MTVFLINLFYYSNSEFKLQNCWDNFSDSLGWPKTETFCCDHQCTSPASFRKSACFVSFNPMLDSTS